MLFISNKNLTTGRTVTYGRIVAGIKPLKSETHRTQLNVGVNLVNFHGDVTTPTSDITT